MDAFALLGFLLPPAPPLAPPIPPGIAPPLVPLAPLLVPPLLMGGLLGLGDLLFPRPLANPPPPTPKPDPIVVWEGAPTTLRYKARYEESEYSVHHCSQPSGITSGGGANIQERAINNVAKVVVRPEGARAFATNECANGRPHQAAPMLGIGYNLLDAAGNIIHWEGNIYPNGVTIGDYYALTPGKEVTIQLYDFRNYFEEPLQFNPYVPGVPVLPPVLDPPPEIEPQKAPNPPPQPVRPGPKPVRPPEREEPPVREPAPDPGPPGPGPKDPKKKAPPQRPPEWAPGPGPNRPPDPKLPPPPPDPLRPPDPRLPPPPPERAKDPQKKREEEPETQGDPAPTPPEVVITDLGPIRTRMEDITPTLTGITRKLATMNAEILQLQRKAAETPQAPEVDLQPILDALDELLKKDIPGTTYWLDHYCEKNPDGTPKDRLEFEVEAMPDPFAAVYERLNALAGMINESKKRKGFICGGKPTGQPVTVLFEDA